MKQAGRCQLDVYSPFISCLGISDREFQLDHDDKSIVKRCTKCPSTRE